MPLNANALTPYATVKAELGLTDDAKQSVLERQVNAASAAIEKYCARAFLWASVVEKLRPPGAYRLVLERTPIDSITSIVNDGTTIESTEYSVEDAGAGFVWRDKGWLANDPRVPGSASADVWIGQGERILSVTYKGGYVPDADVWTASRAVRAGSFIKPSAAGAVNIFQASAAGTTGASEPSWPSAVGGTVTDNGITWTNLGPRTLPEDLEEAAIATTVSLYRARGVDRRVVSEAVGDASVTYGGVNTAIGRGAGGVIPDEVLAILNSYRRLVV